MCSSKRHAPEDRRVGQPLCWECYDYLELATLGWVDWFNHTRLDSSLGDRTPAEVEAEYYRNHHADEQTLPAELTV